MIKAIICDCFGVLLGNAYLEMLAKVEQTNPERANEARSINHASDMGILSHNETAEAISNLFGMDKEDFLAKQKAVELPNQELLDYIQDLKKDYKTALLSNVNSRERLSIRFEDGQLDRCFNTVIASGEEGYVKPEPEIYVLAATRLSVAPDECVMIDDSEDFCEGARRVGMKAIKYNSNSQIIADLNKLLDRGN